MNSYDFNLYADYCLLEEAEGETQDAEESSLFASCPDEDEAE